jgi:cytochrome c-type biogenesis protein CcmH
MLAAFALTIGLASAVTPALTAAQEAEARAVEALLIAPCCWSQQVSVHQSAAANEIRQDIRRRLARGASRQEILDDYVVQFGTAILAEPPARGFSRVLYVLPPIVLIAGAGLVVAVVRRFARTGSEAGSRADTRAHATGSSDGYDRKLDEELENLD